MLDSTVTPRQLHSGPTSSLRVPNDTPFALAEELGLSQSEAISFLYHHCKNSPRPSLVSLLQKLSGMNA